MAYAMTKRGSLDNCVTYEFICDTIADMNAIENEYRVIGTIAIVLQGESEGLEVYITGSDKQWNSLTTVGDTSSATANIPDPPSANGTYNLQVSVSDGVPTYSWVST